MFGWGIGLAIQAFRVFVNDGAFGRNWEKRKIVSYILLAFLFASPFLKVNGNQFLMFNVLERRFNIFGFPFWPQDFHLFVISMRLSPHFRQYFLPLREGFSVVSS